MKILNLQWRERQIASLLFRHHVSGSMLPKRRVNKDKTWDVLKDKALFLPTGKQTGEEVLFFLLLTMN